MSKPKDDGIATLPNGVRISEELRDQLQARDWSKPQRELDTRSANQTTEDLKRTGYSGFRVNDWTRNVELWVLGRVAGTRTCQDSARNPAVLASLHEEVFATTGSIVGIDAKTGQEANHHVEAKEEDPDWEGKLQ